MKFITALFLLLALASDSFAGTLTAQNAQNAPPRIVSGTSVFTKQIIASGVSETHAVEAADLDGDGDLDAIATNFVDGEVSWYENNGTQSFTTHVLDGDLAGAYPAAIADVDLDGDQDVLACGYVADTIAWYENDGTGVFTRHDVDTTADGAHSVVAVDMDQDGDQDLLATNQDEGAVLWYENDGLMGFSRHTLDTGALGAKRAECADFDGDGDLDVVACSYDINEVAWYENDGDEVFAKHIITTSAFGAYYVAPADLDGDGDQDILGASRLDGTIAWYENDGSGSFTPRDIDTQAVGARTVVAVDMDRDGDLDALAASVADQTVGWYENDGAGNFAAHGVDLFVRGAYGVCAVDMNHDGYMDVLSASRDDGVVALHLQVREHRAVLSDPGGVLPIGLSQLHTLDENDDPFSLTYELTLAPTAGDLLLTGQPLPTGGTFTQADINAGRLAYVHGGTPVATDEFAFTVFDQGEDGVMPAAGTFTIYLTNGMLSHWPLDEVAGITAADVTGTFDGVLSSGPTWLPTGGRFGGALSFDGLDDRVDLTGLDVEGGDGITLALWVRPQTLGSAGRLISKAIGAMEQDHLWMVSTQNGDQLRFRLRTANKTSTLIAPQAVLAVDQWCHVACTYDGNKMRIYANGVLLASLPKSGAVNVDPLVAAAIGNQPDGAGSEPFAGLIDDVHLYNRALLPAELLDLVTQGEASGVGDRAHEPGLTRNHLLGNAPNPFNPMTTIRFETVRASTVALTIFDLRGHRVRTLVSGHREAGFHEVTWDGRDHEGRAVPSGVYAYRFQSGGVDQVRRMLLVR